ncbi:MAG: hypothetical protein LLG02_12250 [Pelosinus sp.]|nr:hypothetical protein [Pelosinus sp.]
MWRELLSVLLCFLVEANALANEPSDIAQEEQAVSLARAGHYPEALEQLSQLANSGLQTALFDEIVVLGWAGKHKAAIELYEKNAVAKWPEYVRLSIAGSYYRESNFKVAAALYKEAASTSSQAKRWEAESLMRLGDRAGADSLYNELLTVNPQDSETYISRGNLRLLAGDTTGLDDLDTAVTLAADPKQQTDIRARLGALSIQGGDYNRGINYLKPAIINGSASLFMQADYIFALRLNGDFSTAVQEGRRLWPNYKIVPSYGLQALADASLHSKQYKQAVAAYNSLLARRPEEINRKNVLGGLAFALMQEEQVAKSKAIYTALLQEYPDYAPVAMGDTTALMESGAYFKAQELGGLIINLFPENALYRQQFALLLARQDLNRLSAEEYEKLSKLPRSQPMAGAGLAVNSVAAGDYRSARQGVKEISQQPIKRPLVAEAVKKFDERSLGNASLSVIHQKDYKGNNNTEIGLNGQQQLGDSVAFTMTTASKGLKDNEASINYKTIAPGLIYKDLRQTAEFSWNMYQGGLTASGYRAGYTRYFGDQNSLSLVLSRSPVDQATAAKAGIQLDSQRLQYDKSVGKRDSYTLGLTSSKYSDGNTGFGYDGEYTHIYSDKNEIVRNWKAYFSRSRIKEQEINGEATPYESPSLREAYGLSWQQRWNFPKGYFENTLSIEFNRDYPEKFSFSPYDRIAYNYKLGVNRQLSIGVEYGLRTLSSGSGLWFGYYQYDMSYQFFW